MKDYTNLTQRLIPYFQIIANSTMFTIREVGRDYFYFEGNKPIKYNQEHKGETPCFEVFDNAPNTPTISCINTGDHEDLLDTKIFINYIQPEL